MLADFVVKTNQSKKGKFHFVQTDQTSSVVYDGEEKIAEIKNLQLCNVKFRPSGKIVVGEKVKIPLFWRQYANHENPLRNAGMNGELSVIVEEASELHIKVNSTNQDKSILSNYNVKIDYCQNENSYVFSITARLDISTGKKWEVTYNPTHGEVEFCNFWPDDCFVTSKNDKKKYNICVINNRKGVYKIPHHHLETSDKHNIQMTKRDRFYWLLEEENPIVEILSNQKIDAGICAYMWDAHFGYRVIEPGETKTKQLTDQKFEAEFKMYSINRDSGKRIVDKATQGNDMEMDKIPIYVNGLNTFSKTLRNFPNEATNLWPWTFESDSRLNLNNIFAWDRTKGISDNCSLAIQQNDHSTSRWLVTTLGPAFGKQNFVDGAAYRLSAYVCSEGAEEVSIAIRLHLREIGTVFDINNYEIFYSNQKLSGSSNWQKIEVVTPRISPEPDRLHLILEQKGPGKSWFDNVLFEEFKT